MKKTNRDHQVAREHRALRRKRRSLERSRIITLQQRRHALPRSLAQAFAPLREVTLAALGLSSVMGCEPNEPGNSGAEAGIMAGTGAGIEAGTSAGIEAGTSASPTRVQWPVQWQVQWQARPHNSSLHRRAVC